MARISDWWALETRHLEISSQNVRITKGVVHQWRHASFDKFWSPPPIVTLFISRALVLSSQNHYPFPPLRPWRHLWTTPKTNKETQSSRVIKNRLWMHLLLGLNDQCQCFNLIYRHLGIQYSNTPIHNATGCFGPALLESCVCGNLA